MPPLLGNHHKRRTRKIDNRLLRGGAQVGDFFLLFFFFLFFHFFFCLCALGGAFLLLSIIFGSRSFFAHLCAARRRWSMARTVLSRVRAREREELHSAVVDRLHWASHSQPFFRGLVAPKRFAFLVIRTESHTLSFARNRARYQLPAFFPITDRSERLDIRNAGVTLPSKVRKEQRSAAARNFTPIYFPARTNLRRPGRRNFCGIRVSATGQLIQREDIPSPVVVG